MDSITKHFSYEMFIDRDEVETIKEEQEEQEDITVVSPKQEKQPKEPTKTSKKVADFKAAFSTAYVAQRGNNLNCSPTILALPNGDMKKPSTKLVYNFRKFFAHQTCIAQDPVGYAKSKMNSNSRKAFDFILGGPIAAVADTISSIFLTVKTIAKTISFGIFGAVKYAASIGKNKEYLTKAKDASKEIGGNIYQIVRSAVRITPVIGAPIAVGLSTVAQATQTKFNAIQAERREAQAQKYIERLNLRVISN